MAIFHFFFLILFSLLTFSFSLPSQTVIDATEIISNSGYLSMALTLEIVSSQLRITQLPTATLFAPPDSSFIKSGQPSLSLLRFHFAPLALSLESLQSLPFGSKIPTLSQGDSLFITSDSNHSLSLNNVTVNGSPIFDDGSFVIFGVAGFFDPNYQLSTPAARSAPDFGCVVKKKDDAEITTNYRFEEASEVLRTRGYAVISSFLDLQLLGSNNDQIKMTVFAPNDDAMTRYVGNYSEYASIFLRHVVPCKLSWIDLVNFDDGTALRTYSIGFTMNVTFSGDTDTLMVNGVTVDFPNMYSDDLLVVHGISDILPAPEMQDLDEEEEVEVIDEHDKRGIYEDDDHEF